MLLYTVYHIPWTVYRTPYYNIIYHIPSIIDHTTDHRQCLYFPTYPYYYIKYTTLFLHRCWVIVLTGPAPPIPDCRQQSVRQLSLRAGNCTLLPETTKLQSGGRQPPQLLELH